MFSPDISADIYEKWIGFLALVSSAIALMLLTGTIAYFTAGDRRSRPCGIWAKG